jgi:hypothetical protein
MAALWSLDLPGTTLTGAFAVPVPAARAQWPINLVCQWRWLR